jgi:uncharacterized pyridoxamine 5'-phosphate oxidase family protein
MGKRALAIEYFIKSLCTGERSAAQRLESFLADDVVYDTNSQPGVPPIQRETFSGRAEVLFRVSGDWPATGGYGRLGWAEPAEEGDHTKVVSSSAVWLEFKFNDKDQIQSVRLDGGWGSGMVANPPTGGKVEGIPLVLRGLINNARVNNTPFSVTYVDGEGKPHSSFRGSVCVLSGTQVAIWVRDANGGLPRALDTNPHVSLVYNDLRGGTMITVLGRAKVEKDEEIRRKVYEIAPEVEQTHDLGRNGVAVVIDIDSLQSFSGGLAFRMGS